MFESDEFRALGAPHPGERRKTGEARHHHRHYLIALDTSFLLRLLLSMSSRPSRSRNSLHAGSKRWWLPVKLSLTYNERHLQALEKRVLDVPQEVCLHPPL